MVSHSTTKAESKPLLNLPIPLVNKSSQNLFWTPNRGMRIQHTIK